ncbi:hypothetical protein K466DRAFT_27511 [Polyporus arcularius HHB13444]|uniref:Uncharacterized protein n=1 Tax=Polyporus arcularius HHB13444 TaxID=1314778 RepID=A0A5C3PTN4_9APHY|nr:hypothetical protein K466DRAFT_27511 [Polyporus arcularius HHB13444]
MGATRPSVTEPHTRLYQTHQTLYAWFCLVLCPFSFPFWTRQNCAYNVWLARLAGIELGILVTQYPAGDPYIGLGSIKVMLLPLSASQQFAALTPELCYESWVTEKPSHP